MFELIIEWGTEEEHKILSKGIPELFDKLEYSARIRSLEQKS